MSSAAAATIAGFCCGSPVQRSFSTLSVFRLSRCGSFTLGGQTSIRLDRDESLAFSIATTSQSTIVGRHSSIAQKYRPRWLVEAASLTRSLAHLLSLTHTRARTHTHTHTHTTQDWEMLVILRLVSFAAISVLFADKPDIQAGLGLFLLFMSIWAHNKTSPYLEDDLDRVEEIGLIASWLTLYGGTLLYSGSLSSFIKIVVTISIIMLNLAFALYILYVLAIPHVSKMAGEGGLSAMPGRFRSLAKSFSMSNHQDDGGLESSSAAEEIEMSSVVRPRTSSELALYTKRDGPMRLSSGRRLRLERNPISARKSARRQLGLPVKDDDSKVRDRDNEATTKIYSSPLPATAAAAARSREGKRSTSRPRSRSRLRNGKRAGRAHQRGEREATVGSL